MHCIVLQSQQHKVLFAPVTVQYEQEKTNLHIIKWVPFKKQLIIFMLKTHIKKTAIFFPTSYQWQFLSFNSFFILSEPQ